MNLTTEFQDSSILVTGGAGAIGSNLVTELLTYDPKEVVVLDDFSSGYRWLLPTDDALTIVEGSVLNDEKLKRVYKRDLDYVFHLAAHFANKNSVDHPETDLQVNGLGTLKTLEYAQMQDLDRYVYASSGCGIYGGDAEIPYEEDDFTIDHGTPYQITKQVGEMYAKYFNNLYDLPVANARFFNSFGPGEVPGKYRNVIPNFFYWARHGRPLPITGDGTETRDWTYVGDIVDGLLRMAVAEDAIGESFNLATGQDTEVIEMAQMINERVNDSAGIDFMERRDWDDKPEIVGSIEKSQRILDYEPTTSFADGLDEVHEWFEANSDRIEAAASDEFEDHDPA
ncbi:NAD-dependent epimerase/dehydratase family protein [Halorubrum sp. GN11GM_10-3_MGM]|uniref:NAD-dependent epimerase/dehydratase family protein n=1 Tax=Halorubrum sp. GN11GM_10-3_MGM TaxID=2518111 RepID=UPI0010F63B20|nr:NAD-dependent epimerase/dehydratase family protein [Halorubrum sp. GN11GM_10-3_MGM]TKX67642.1 NAD-dependent epimerase/dehydratase family protein [Halorubrum sp. GN11GM_10-3_MGM]